MGLFDRYRRPDDLPQGIPVFPLAGALLPLPGLLVPAHGLLEAAMVPLEALSALLMRSLARGLGLDEHSFDAAFEGGISTLRPGGQRGSQCGPRRLRGVRCSAHGCGCDGGRFSADRLSG